MSYSNNIVCIMYHKYTKTIFAIHLAFIVQKSAYHNAMFDSIRLVNTIQSIGSIVGYNIEMDVRS